MTPWVQRSIGLALVSSGIGLGLTRWISRHEEVMSVDNITEKVATQPEDLPTRNAGVVPAETPMPIRQRQPSPELTSDGIPIMRAQGDSTLQGPRHPHPITPRHQRIYRENAILGALNGAVDSSDPETIRRLSQQYQAEFPEDEPGLQSGYELIADCLERRDAETVARAERYFNEERGSTLRRYVKRHCL